MPGSVTAEVQYIMFLRPVPRGKVVPCKPSEDSEVG